MTAYVKFSVDAENHKLRIEAITDEANTLETIFAKKALSISTRLAFVELQEIGVFDIGAQIVINSYGYSDVTLEKIVSELDNSIESESSEADETEMNWKVGEHEVRLSLDLDDANEIIGGLASVTATSAMTVFVLLKKTIHAVEEHYGLEHQEYSMSENDDDEDYFEYEDEEETLN